MWRRRGGCRAWANPLFLHRTELLLTLIHIEHRKKIKQEGTVLRSHGWDTLEARVGGRGEWVWTKWRCLESS